MTPAERWMAREHPDKVAMRTTPHDYVPMSLGLDPDHVCRGSCYCERCWERKSERIHTKIARREAGL